MRQDRGQKDAQSLATRRGVLVLGAQLAMAGVLGFRMRQLQIQQADEFLLLAEETASISV